MRVIGGLLLLSGALSVYLPPLVATKVMVHGTKRLLSA